VAKFTIDDVLTFLARNPALGPLTEFDLDAAGVLTPIHEVGSLLTDAAGFLAGGPVGAEVVAFWESHSQTIPLGWVETGFTGVGTARVRFNVPRGNDR
jgi:hypothetical protein